MSSGLAKVLTTAGHLLSGARMDFVPTAVVISNIPMAVINLFTTIGRIPEEAGKHQLRRGDVKISRRRWLHSSVVSVNKSNKIG